ncbi:MAG: hypothetical protein HYU64_07310, partial [Armatimonadetes bacterium]|nr:hypothetical protein [Armatimonadota bacterium]
RPVNLDVLLSETPALTKTQGNIQHDFDMYAQTLQNEGYQVLRVPHAEPGPFSSYISYNNCLMEQFKREDGTEVKRVFLPQYGVQRLDTMATETWQSIGFEVIPMPLASLAARWGALRCISQWLDRDPRG